MKKKIESMTPEQEAQMVEFREEWRAIGLKSGPADAEAIRPTINSFYGKIGKEAPYIWRCESPLTAHLVLHFLKNSGFDKANLGDNLWANLRANLGDNLGDNLRANLWANLRDNLRDNLWANLRANLGDNLRDNKIEYIPTNLWGSGDSYWIAWALFPHEFLRKMHTDEQVALLNGWAEFSKSTFWWYPFDGICFICDRPKTSWDERWFLHNDKGPAIEFSDGWKLYYWHSIQVPERAIAAIETYTAVEILAEQNTEVRRALMSLYGWDRILPEVNAKLLDEHPDPTIGKLYEFEVEDQKYHVVQAAEHRQGVVFPARVYTIGTRTSLNKVVASLKDTYPLYRDLTDAEYLSIPRV